jgi:hypothetical protein
MIIGFTTNVHSVPTTANIVSSNHADDKVYSIQHYVKKLPPPINKADHPNITEIVKKVAINTII